MAAVRPCPSTASHVFGAEDSLCFATGAQARRLHPLCCAALCCAAGSSISDEDAVEQPRGEDRLAAVSCSVRAVCFQPATSPAIYEGPRRQMSRLPAKPVQPSQCVSCRTTRSRGRGALSLRREHGWASLERGMAFVKRRVLDRVEINTTPAASYAQLRSPHAESERANLHPELIIDPARAASTSSPPHRSRRRCIPRDSQTSAMALLMLAWEQSRSLRTCQDV